MKTLENFNQAIENEGLTSIQINTDGNDYPKGLGSYGAIGFETFKEAEAFAEENGGEIVVFETKGGHTFWRNKGGLNAEFSCLDIMDTDGNMEHVDFTSLKESFQERLKEIEANNVDGVIDLLTNYQTDLEFLQNIDEGNIAVKKYGFKGLDEIPIKTMQFSYDVYTYAIGVYFNPVLHEEEEN